MTTEHVTGAQPTGSEPTTPIYPFKDGYLKLPNTVFYSLYPTLKMEQRVVYEELYAATHGFGENPRRVSRKQMCVRLSTDEKRLRRIVKTLEAKGLVRVVDEVRSGANENRGTVFWVWAPEVGGIQPATSRRPVTGRQPVAGRAPAHEREEKEIMKTPVAAAPAVDVFGIRTIAARLFEVHRGESGFDHDRLRQLVETTLVGQGTVAEGTLIDEAIRGDGTVSEIGKISGVFGLGGLGAVIGAVGGGVLGVLIGIVFGGMPALNWFRVQPPDWWIFSGAAAIVFTIIVTLIALVAGAILGALVIGGVTVVTSSLWAAKQP